MSYYMDLLLTKEQRESCARWDQPVAPLDVSRQPDSCAAEGAAPVVSYDAGRVIRESEDDRWMWTLAPIVGVLSILAAWIQFGGPL